MTALVWANFPLALLFLAAWTGIPLWMTVRHPDAAPDFSEARAYLDTKEALAAATLGEPATTAAQPDAALAAADAPSR